MRYDMVPSTKGPGNVVTHHQMMGVMTVKMLSQISTGYI